jgi:hypothetical protein
MTTLSDQFSAGQGEAADFTRAWFWACLHRRGLVLVPLCALLGRDFFAPDRELLDRVARVRTLRELDEEIRDFRADARNQTLWRKVAGVRVSTRRLRRLARPLLAPPARHP